MCVFNDLTGATVLLFALWQWP